MNAALNYCWKEWRAQRGLLIAYTLLVFTALCLGLYLAPRHYWYGETFGVHAISWFVTAACIGVIVFVVPNLVRAEFTNKDDQFVRRLPGALKPAFYGKLMFLALVTIALPLFGLLVGELYVLARGGDWNGLFSWDWQGNVSLRFPGILPEVGFVLLLLPWVWAVGQWVPGGRLALLGATLLVLIIGVGVFAVLRQSPNIVKGIDWTPWLWTVPVSGLLAAAISWRKGRRGGGPLRSARFGLSSLAIMLLPGAIWLAERTWRYHHPDLTDLAGMAVIGVDPDGRFALADVVQNGDWQSVVARIDLQTGEAEQVAGVGMHITPEAVRPELHQGRAAQRYWRGLSVESNFILDLQTGERHLIDVDENYDPVISPALTQLLREDHNRRAKLAAPGGVRVRMEGGHFEFDHPDGTTERVDWPFHIRSYTIVGHGLCLYDDGKWHYYGFGPRQARAQKSGENAWYVGMKMLVKSHRSTIRRSGERRKERWFVCSEDGEREPCEAMQGAKLLGVFDDERVLASICRRGQAARLFVYNVATGEMQDVQLPPGLGDADSSWTRVSSVAPMRERGSELIRDPRGHVWLHCSRGMSGHYLSVDVESLSAHAVQLRGDISRGTMLMSWDRMPYVVHADGLEIVETNIDTGERRTLFRGGRWSPRR